MQQTSVRTSISIILIAILLTCFYISYYKAYPVDYDNLEGAHSWLTASTIKFVNNWLAEGASELHFTNMENPASIEFQTFQSRMPYTSYPTGSTALVWAAAKAAGVDHIDCSFVKHFAQKCLWAETILTAVFFYLFLSRTTELSEIKKAFFAACLGAVWMVLPANSYYLINSYFADQAVILFVSLFYVLDYVRSWDLIRKNRPLQVLFTILEILTIFCGVLTDYYFWILAFFTFLFDLIANILSRKYFRLILRSSSVYVVPVFAALTVFLWQIHFTENWVKHMVEVFLFRTGMDDHDIPVWDMLEENILQAFANGYEIVLIYFMIYILCTAFILVYWLKNRQGMRTLFSSRNASTVTAYFLAVVFQILLLKNHSAIHELSMIKIGWAVLMLMILPFIAVGKLFENGKAEISLSGSKRKFPASAVTLCLCILTVLSMLNFPASTHEYYQKRCYYADYTVPREIGENTDYNDVCFSFTRNISYMPPHDLAVSGKCVYQINSVEELKEQTANLDPDANLVLVVEKGVLPPAGTGADQEKMAEAGTVFYESEDLILISLDNLN